MIDRIREIFPHLSIGVYALEPGQPLTVEVMTPDGTRYSRTATTADEAFTSIFGPLPDEAPAEEIKDDEREPVVDPFD
jgi:hypothetical protein